MASTSDTTFATGRVATQFAFQVARSQTSNAPVGVTIPAGFVTTAVRVFGTTVSNAGTAATISVGSTGATGTGTGWLSSFDVKTAGANLSVPSTVTLAGFSLPVAAQVTAAYAEAGSASTAGGPWTVVIEGFPV